MNLETQKITVQKSAKEIFEFLIDLNNFEGLMPESKEKFEVDGDSFLFGLKGMPEIRLVLQEQIEYSKIVLAAASSKLAFTLTLDINELDDTSSENQLFFKGDFNPMMAMMIKKPLQSFINTLSENMSKL
ncbi:MAG: SRPBCC family protein [Flavobacteriaceae bacterium]